MKLRSLRVLALATLLVLAGCKTDLYRALPEAEANQMLALLMLRHIPADKQVDSEGNVTLRVEPDRFIDAVEVMRQNGFPKRKSVTMADVFPSNQLVTSPAQERAKMIYLKEQQLEHMLMSFDGVITANVSIAQTTDDSGRQSLTPSASVFIKYSPEFNLNNREAEIKRLIRDSVPDIESEKISVVLQAAEYRYVPPASQSKPRFAASAMEFVTARPQLSAGIAGGIGLLLVGATGALMLLLRRAKPQKRAVR
jgi:type III secretion protein J